MTLETNPTTQATQAKADVKPWRDRLPCPFDDADVWDRFTEALSEIKDLSDALVQAVSQPPLAQAETLARIEWLAKKIHDKAFLIEDYLTHRDVAEAALEIMVGAKGLATASKPSEDEIANVVPAMRDKFEDAVKKLRNWPEGYAYAGFFDQWDSGDYKSDWLECWWRIWCAATPSQPSEGESVGAQPAMEWISVKDRLPQHRGDVLVFYGGEFYGIGVLRVPHEGSMLWHGHSGSHNAVSHWMNLPADPTQKQGQAK